MAWTDWIKRPFASEDHAAAPALEETAQDQSFLDTNQAFVTKRTTGDKWRGDELLWIRGNGIYRKMLDDDQIEAALSVMHAAIVGRKWAFEVEDPDTQQEIADVLTHNLLHSMKGTLRDVVLAMLTARVEGFAMLEQAFATFQMDGKTWWGLDEIKLRPPESFYFEVDFYGNITKLLQEQMENTREELDITRFIHYVHRPDLDRHYGRSALLGAYPHYFAKKELYKYWSIFAERLGGGFMVGNTETELSQTQMDNFQKVLKNIQTATAIIAPKGIEIKSEVPNDPGTFENAIMSRNNAIIRTLLVPTLLGFSEETGSGSEARSRVQAQVWHLILDQIAESIADALNEQVFRQVVWWNFGDGVQPPLFKFESLTQEEKDKFAETWITAHEKGAVLNTFEDELRLREMLHFPAREEDAEPAQEPVTLPVPPRATPGQDPSDQDQGIEPEVPDGINPLDSASRGLRAAAPDRTPDLEDIRFGERFDVERQLKIVDRRETAFGKVLWRGLKAAYVELDRDMRGPLDFATVEQLVVSPEIQAEMEVAGLRELTIAFNEGREAGRDALNVAAKEHGRPSFPKLEKANPQVGFMARMEFAGLSLEDAEAFLTTKIQQASGRIINEQLLAAIREAIIFGLRNELPVDEMIANAQNAVVRLVGDFGPAGGIEITDTLPAHVATVTRTVLTEAYNAGLQSFFEDPELDGYVEAYQYSAVLDGRTTEFCRNAHGKIWPVDSTQWRNYIPPNHFNCRSRIIPVVEDDEWTASKDVTNSAGQPVRPSPGFGEPNDG